MNQSSTTAKHNPVPHTEDTNELRDIVYNVKSQLAFYKGIGLTLITMGFTGFGVWSFIYSDMSERHAIIEKQIVTAAHDITALEHKHAKILSRWDEISTRTSQLSNMVAKTEVLLYKVTTENKTLSENRIALESYLSKIIQMPTNTQFIVEMDVDNGNYTIEPGDGIPYSRKLTGSHCSATILVPPKVLCLIKGTCKWTTFEVHPELKERIVFDIIGDYNKIRYNK